MKYLLLELQLADLPQEDLSSHPQPTPAPQASSPGRTRGLLLEPQPHPPSMATAGHRSRRAVLRLTQG